MVSGLVVGLVDALQLEVRCCLIRGTGLAPLHSALNSALKWLLVEAAKLAHQELQRAIALRARMCRVGQNHIYIYIYDV